MTDPEWDAFLCSLLGLEIAPKRARVANQHQFFGAREDFGGYPAKFFQTMAGGILQELLAKCANDKELVAARAGMSVKNLYPILNGRNDPKLGTLLKIIHANGHQLSWRLVSAKSRQRK